jgi:hypothetical protein
MSNEEVEIKAMKAVLFFQDGWSLSMSMSKAGFTASWAEKIEIISHPLIKTLRAMSRNKPKYGNQNHNRLKFNL